MKTVNSLSGGKTSSYLAAHYPADYDLFALVCVDSHNAGKKIDKKIKQMVNDKLQKYCSEWPEFVATTEDPLILNVVFDLEQHIGREIIWLRGMGWEKMMDIRQAIPNMAKRFCTTIMKIEPIFKFLFPRVEFPVKMRVGYRYDEKERKDTFTDEFKFATHMEQQATRWIYRWSDINWRVGDFPLIDNLVTHPRVQNYWKDKNITFPLDSNCQNCFWKKPQQLRKNFDTNKAIMYWAAIQEEMRGRTFKEELSLLQISRLGLQLDFEYGTGSGCQAGFCTD